jgi:flavin reductase (DIM6/NTAB) family NADH-FMN oxidoreductase RutF
MDSARVAEWAGALGFDSGSVFALASEYGRSRSIILVRWVQFCCVDPPMVAVPVRKGRPIEPIIRDSHAFALSRLDPAEAFIWRKLQRADEHADDPLELIDYDGLVTGAPCIKRAQCSLDCEVVRHIDLEGDHELYVGQIVGMRSRDPEVSRIANGLALAPPSSLLPRRPVLEPEEEELAIDDD